VCLGGFVCVYIYDIYIVVTAADEPTHFMLQVICVCVCVCVCVCMCVRA